jgi:gluconate 2-dehydrogenase gamma chain
MKRRELLKAIPLTGLGMAVLPSDATADDLQVKPQAATAPKEFKGGRSPEEQAHDAKLNAQKFFTAHELATVTVLCDIIIPADDRSGSASQAGVPAFIEFTMKDQPSQQTPVRGGIKWLDNQCVKRYGKKFVACTKVQQIEMVDAIAYPEKAKPEVSQGVAFFGRMRNLTASGFYTSKIGIADIGYVGNTPNLWAGVPQDVLDKYGVAYDPNIKYADMV